MPLLAALTAALDPLFRPFLSRCALDPTPSPFDLVTDKISATNKLLLALTRHLNFCCKLMHQYQTGSARPDAIQTEPNPTHFNSI